MIDAKLSMPLLQPVVLSGGSGTRLWPLSREQFPKQLLSLTGADTLLQATLRRVQGLPGVQLLAPIVVCNEDYRFVTAEQLRQMGPATQGAHIVLEPKGRNTAPALAVAALDAIQSGADPVLLVMPADHVIVDGEAFQQAVAQALVLAGQGSIVTFGITPTAPETGYGYIQARAEGGSPEPGGARRIARFVEKPDAATAQTYLDAGCYLWNSGLFVGRASVWLSALKACRADILTACEQAHALGRPDGDFVRLDAAAFAACPSDSIDYAVMERITQGGANLPPAWVLPLSAGWSDVGAWDALWQVLDKDADGNVARGDTLLQGCHNTLALSESRLVACVGVRDLVVVETPDATLVVDQRHTQDVKAVVEALRAQGRAEGRIHRKVARPWGWYDGIDAGERFQVKRIVVKPGAALSLQMHHHRAEHWIVVSGTARVTCGDKVLLLAENQSTYIPLGTRHRLENPGVIDLEIIEVQSGAYLGEDDIVRFEDVYGR